MKCPVCKDVTLLMSEKKGVEIDYCPECRGIWLDRGELEKLIEKEEKFVEEEYSRRRDYERKEYDKDNYDRRVNDKKDYDRREYESKDSYYHDDDYKYKKHKRKKESFFGEIFDVFGGDDD